MAIENEEKVEGENPDTKAPESEDDQSEGPVSNPETTTDKETEVAPDADSDPADNQDDDTDADPASVLSYGEKMVGKSFNPGGDPKVDNIKTLCAEVIDLCNEPANLSADKAKLYETAVTQMIIAQMCAVKFITFKN